MLDNFLSNVELQPLADVANNLVNKLSKTIGFIFLPRGKYLHKIEAENTL